MGFNRYIVECKLQHTFSMVSCRQDLIDTQWNVNDYPEHRMFSKYTDLIDTQWNVNIFPLTSSMSTGGDLIDTQWNVNTFEAFGENLQVRFNRYIVECKSRQYRTLYGVQIDLIDTQWNVNS